MELIAVAVMLVAGLAIAVFVLAAAAIAKREGGSGERQAASDRDTVAGSILFQLLVLGGSQPPEALREIRRETGIAGVTTGGVDISNWAAAFARSATTVQCEWLLDAAVRVVVAQSRMIPLPQYAALLDLSFSLGFHTDALARLRERYGFDYVDHAKDARPREADRAGGVTFFAREPGQTAELLRVLGLSAEAGRPAIIAAYHRMAAQHHPDRFHASSADEQSQAAARFIEITRVYESLLAIYRD
jgi:hypothetical protein